MHKRWTSFYAPAMNPWVVVLSVAGAVCEVVGATIIWAGVRLRVPGWPALPLHWRRRPRVVPVALTAETSGKGELSMDVLRAQTLPGETPEAAALRLDQVVRNQQKDIDALRTALGRSDTRLSEHASADRLKKLPRDPAFGFVLILLGIVLSMAANLAGA